MSFYRNLLTEASSITSADIHTVSIPLNHRTSTSSILSQRAHNVAKILLLCDFRLGGMICCLGGAYTSNFLDFASINACNLVIYGNPVDPWEPPHDFPVLKQFFHQHIPCKDSL